LPRVVFGSSSRTHPAATAASIAEAARAAGDRGRHSAPRACGRTDRSYSPVCCRFSCTTPDSVHGVAKRKPETVATMTWRTQSAGRGPRPRGPGLLPGP
jgi:hypothetical protein